MSDVQPYCNTVGHHVFIKTIKYSMKKCLYCHQRCLFRLRKMFKCKECAKVMHIRCLVRANHSHNLSNRIEQNMLNIAAWRDFYGEGGNPCLMAEHAAMCCVTMFRQMYDKTQPQQAGITNGNRGDGQIQVQEENVKATDGNGDGQIQVKDENVKATDGNGDGQMKAEVNNFKTTDGNSVVQIQAEDKIVKAADGNGDGQIQAEDENVETTDGNSGIQVQAEDENIKVMNVNGDREMQAEVKNFKETDGNGVVQIRGKCDQLRAVKMPIVSSAQYQPVRVLGVVGLSLNLADGNDYQKLLLQLIQSTFKTVHRAYIAVLSYDFIEFIWITRVNQSKCNCINDYLRGYLSDPIPITDVLSVLSKNIKCLYRYYVEFSQSSGFEKKNNVKFKIVFGVVVINIDS